MISGLFPFLKTVSRTFLHVCRTACLRARGGRIRNILTAKVPLIFFAGGLSISPFSGIAQTPTGRSYTTELKRPTNPAPQFPSPITLTDITARSGISFKHNASPTSLKYLPETMGAGVGLIDYDSDGRLDIFFTNGARIADPMPKGTLPDKADPKYWNRLYRQKADGSFEDVTERAGLRGEGYCFGVAVGDYDKDGHPDLFVTRYGGSVLYRNNGNGSFSDVTKTSGVTVDGWPTSAGFFDYDNDGRLDLFVVRYVDWDFEKGSIHCGDTRPGNRSYCHPDNFQSTGSLLFRQKPNGTFEDVSGSSGISSNKGKALGVSFADFDDDGHPDIFVANDNSEQQLFRNKGNGTFENVALASGVAFNENGNRFSGMGVDAADFDNDGKMDVVITVLSNETYPLYRNRSEWFFDYVTQTTGVGQISVLNTGWGVKFLDIDNDGKRDIFAAQGHVMDTIERINTFLKYRQPPLLMRNTGKEFQDISMSAGDVFKTGLAARGMASGDLDNDGDTDVVISQTDGPAVILRNDGPKTGPKNHWTGIDLRGKGSAANGEGARVSITSVDGKKQVFDISGSGSYLAANDMRMIAGLGTASGVRRIEVRWPTGKIQMIENPTIDRYHVIKEQ